MSELTNKNKKNRINYKEISEKLKNGSLILYPTDTLYGLGASIESVIGLKKVYTVKRRDFSSPLIALISHPEKIEEIASVDNRDILNILIKHFWPGALTIILKKKSVVPNIMVSDGNTVGIRMPNNETALNIIDAVGGILPTTSANISGELPPVNFEDISNEILDKVDIQIQEFKAKKIKIESSELTEQASTIINLSGDSIQIIREGIIPLKDIEELLGTLKIGGYK